jgi:hypothetical protein
MYALTSNENKGAHDMYSQYNGGQVDEAFSAVMAFGNLIGWPKGFDGPTAAGHILQFAPNMDAKSVNWALFEGQLTPAQQKATPGAKYGMDNQTYEAKSRATAQLYHTMSGSTIDAKTLDQALGENWTAKDFENHFQYGDPRGEGFADPKSTPDLVKSNAEAPWMAAGEQFDKVQQQFVSSVGHLPVTKHELASWWSFNQSAKSVGSGRGAGSVAPPSQSNAIPGDVEVR